jgi:hypothetical protein
MRYACNIRLRNALYQWARVAAICDPASQTYYAAPRGRGHSYARALRALGDRLLRVLIAMLKNDSLYDALKHRSRPTPSSSEEVA